MSTLGFFEGFLDDQIVIGSELKEEKMDLLSSSIQESGLFNDQTEVSVVPYGVVHKLQRKRLLPD